MRLRYWLSAAAGVIVLVLYLQLGGTDAAEGTPLSIPVPAAVGSGMYTLTADSKGMAYLSWIEPVGQEHALRFATLTGNQWSSPRTVARGSNWFVNWADRPSVVAMPNGVLAAHWLVNNGTKQGVYGYGIRVAFSKNHGATWRETFSAGTDNLTEYSGFVSFLPDNQGLSAVYLTPKLPLSTDGHDHTMTLNVLRFTPDGTPQPVRVVDTDTCSCCTTSIVQTARGPVVAYRDHEPGEVRDISIVRFEKGRWTEPAPVHRDGWVINACPTNGPVLAASANRVAAAWFTAAHDKPMVKVAFSDDAGATFSSPAVVDGGKPIGWPAIVLLDDGAAAVTWLESIAGGAGEIRLRRVGRDGRAGPVALVAHAPAGRSTGIPQMVRSGGALIVAWRDGSVKSARMALP